MDGNQRIQVDFGQNSRLKVKAKRFTQGYCVAAFLHIGIGQRNAKPNRML